MLNNNCQFKIQAHRLNRNSSQDITVVYDVTSKESINKHISNSVNTKEAEDFSKSEAELVDVMDTLKHAISIIEKEMAKNTTFSQKKIDTRNTNSIMAALAIRKTSRSRAFSEQC